jgi:hypothetical protein
MCICVDMKYLPVEIGKVVSNGHAWLSGMDFTMVHSRPCFIRSCFSACQQHRHSKLGTFKVDQLFLGVASSVRGE